MSCKLLPASASFLLRVRTPTTQFQRYRGKINIQRPRDPHYERARVLEVTKPQYPLKQTTTTCFQKNPRYEQEQVVNPYNDIIAREVHNWLDHSRMVGIYHLNSINSDDLFRIRVLLHKQNMHLKSYGKKIIEKAVVGTKFEAIQSLFDSSHCMVFSSEQRVTQLVRLTRKVPQMLLLAGIVDDTLLSRNEFIAYGQQPSLQVGQAELVRTLNMAAGNLVQHLETHQNNFVNVLDVHAKGEGQAEETSTETPPEQ